MTWEMDCCLAMHLLMPFIIKKKKKKVKVVKKKENIVFLKIDYVRAD